MTKTRDKLKAVKSDAKAHDVAVQEVKKLINKYQLQVADKPVAVDTSHLADAIVSRDSYFRRSFSTNDQTPTNASAGLNSSINSNYLAIKSSQPTMPPSIMVN